MNDSSAAKARSKPAQVKALMARGECIAVPCVYDALTALMVERAGFPLTFVSGGLLAGSMGLPDLGLATMSEIATRMGEIASAVRIPVLGDADTGYGNALNVWRTVEAFERAGLAGLMLEDQVFPKRCGHLAGKAVIGRDEAVQKIRAAREAASDPDFIIIGRTDAVAIEGVDAAIDRANAYGDAGATIIFIETPRSEADLEKMAKQIRYPRQAVSMAGVGMPVVPRTRLTELGFCFVMHPADLAQVALKAIEDVLGAIERDDLPKDFADKSFNFHQIAALTHTPEYMALEKKYA
jgi:2-methylisocitrate lyase-like PEP mutase family enzyme